LKLLCQYHKTLHGNAGCETSERAVCKLYFIKYTFDANMLSKAINFTVERTQSTVIRNEIDRTQPVVFYSIANE